MRFRRARPFAHALFAVCVLSTPARPGTAQTHDDHATMGSCHKLTPQQNALVKAVRDATKPCAGATTIAGRTGPLGSRTNVGRPGRGHAADPGRHALVLTRMHGRPG
jgi:hypothetical protein